MLEDNILIKSLRGGLGRLNNLPHHQTSQILNI